MKEGGWSGRTISLGYKLDTFETFSRASSLPKGRYIHRFEDLYQEGKKILMKELKARQTLFDSGGKVVGCGGKRELRLRLMGLTMSNLRDEQAIAEQAKKGLDSWVVTLKEQDNVTAGQSSKHRLEDNEVKLFEADDLVQGVDIREGDEEEEEKEFRFRPYYTGGPSINSKRHSTNGQVSPRHQLRFDAPVKGKGKEETTEEYECPVCLKLFQMGLGEFNSHVDQCLNRSLVLDLTKDSDDDSIENAVSTKGTERNKVTTGTQKRRSSPLANKAKDKEKKRKRPKTNTLDAMWGTK
ncbi:hypothetical protein BT69DRAFT_147546 [Atractiella rhizophila]|nr:hypothetical protein BT69DRAFT_147546 [Atractiella rhizophila]